jgi:hypothetical protein
LEQYKRYKKWLMQAQKKIKIAVPKESYLYGFAKDCCDFAERYRKDGKFFEDKGDYERALAAYSYAHAWLDAGVRLGVLDGRNDHKLFTHYK